MSEQIISADLVANHNSTRQPALERDYASLGERLDRRGIAIDAIRDKMEKFGVAIPSWG
ncbi:MAG: sugar isomerase, partial [Mesorhizobium sp.]